MLSICLPRLRLFIFYSDHAQYWVPHKSSAPSDVVSPWGAEWSKRRRSASSWGLQNWCALLVLARVTLKNQKHSASGTVAVSLLINLNPPPQLSSTLFRLWSSQIPSAHVLKFLLCAGRLREYHTGMESDSARFVEYWVNVLCITTLCQIVRQPWWKKKAIREDVWSSRWFQNSNVAGPDYNWQANGIWQRLRLGRIWILGERGSLKPQERMQSNLLATVGSGIIVSLWLALHILIW